MEKITWARSDGNQERNRLDKKGLTLKVLSSEMDPVEIRLIRKIFIKGSIAAGF